MKKTIIIGGIVVIVLAIVAYYYYPFTQTGCNNLKEKIEKQISNAGPCNLAEDCIVSIDLGCDFNCGGYFSNKVDKGLISRYQRRCSTCHESCYFKSTNPVCLNHICQTTGGAVFFRTNKPEYLESEEINLQVTSNLLNEVGYSFPITLCLRPVIMRLEKYNEETTEWLSSGVGLLFENNKVIFYENPGECPAYKIKNCTSEEAEKFIDIDTLKINEFRNYTVPATIVQACGASGQENSKPMQGRYRIGLYYEPPEDLGKQIYSNEFVIK